MAFRIILEVIQNRELAGHAKLLAIVLANYADKERGIAWPSQETLASVTGLSRRTIQRTLPILEGIGILRVKKGNGRTHASTYQFASPENGDRMTPFRTEKGVNLSKKDDRVTPDPIKTKKKKSFVSQNLSAKKQNRNQKRGNGVVL